MGLKDKCTKLIAELHTARYSNEAIGILLANYGGKNRDEATIRRWAMRQNEPKGSDWEALQALHDDVFHVEKSAEVPTQVVAVENQEHII